MEFINDETSLPPMSQRDHDLNDDAAGNCFQANFGSFKKGTHNKVLPLFQGTAVQNNHHSLKQVFVCLKGKGKGKLREGNWKNMHQNHNQFSLAEKDPVFNHKLASFGAKYLRMRHIEDLNNFN